MPIWAAASGKEILAGEDTVFRAAPGSEHLPLLWPAAEGLVDPLPQGFWSIAPGTPTHSSPYQRALVSDDEGPNDPGTKLEIKHGQDSQNQKAKSQGLQSAHVLLKVSEALPALARPEARGEGGCPCFLVSVVISSATAPFPTPGGRHPRPDARP